MILDFMKVYHVHTKVLFTNININNNVGINPQPSDSYSPM